jgi:hypothetical protein
VTLSGDVGPLNLSGLPLSLAGLTNVEGGEYGNYHQKLIQFIFSSTSTVPEPAAWVMSITAIGLGLAVYWSTRRDRRR